MSELEPTEQGLADVTDFSIAELANSDCLPEGLKLSIARVVDGIADPDGALSAFESFVGQ